jgi:NADPH-dependent curcumin reductase CurA
MPLSKVGIAVAQNHPQEKEKLQKLIKSLKKKLKVEMKYVTQCYAKQAKDDGHKELADMLEKGDLQLKSNAQLIQEWVEYRDLNG